MMLPPRTALPSPGFSAGRGSGGIHARRSLCSRCAPEQSPSGATDAVPTPSTAATNWTAALEAAQAKAAALRASSLGAASAVQAGAKAAAQHPITSQLWERSRGIHDSLPEDAKRWLPTGVMAGGALAVTALVLSAGRGGGGSSEAEKLGKALSPRLDDVSYLQAELLKSLEEKKILTRRVLEAELALGKAQAALAANTAGTAKAKR